jgi:hypothetical protein
MSSGGEGGMKEEPNDLLVGRILIDNGEVVALGVIVMLVEVVIVWTFKDCALLCRSFGCMFEVKIFLGGVVGGETFADKTVTGKLVVGEMVAGKVVMGETVAGEVIAGEVVAVKEGMGETVAGEVIAGKVVTSGAVTDEMVICEDVGDIVVDTGGPVVCEVFVGGNEKVAGWNIIGNGVVQYCVTSESLVCPTEDCAVKSGVQTGIFGRVITLFVGIAVIWVGFLGPIALSSAVK